MSKDCDKFRAVLRAVMNFKVLCNEWGGDPCVAVGLFPLVVGSACRVERSSLLWQYSELCPVRTRIILWPEQQGVCMERKHHLAT